MQTDFARSWALERIAADSGLQIRQIGEYVRLAAKFVGNHWRLAGNRGDHRDANAASLHSFDQRAKISAAGEKHDLIDAVSKLHRIDCKLDVHVALDLPVAVGVDKFLGRLGHHGEAIVIKPIEQRANRRELLILSDRGVVKCPHQRSATLKFL